VLSHLTPGELCRAGLACRGLLHLTRDPSLWPALTLLGDALAGPATVLALLTRCTQLATVSITARDDAPQLVAAMARHCPLLASLTVRYDGPVKGPGSSPDPRFCPPVPHSALAALAAGCPRLATLDLESTGATNSGCGEWHEEGCT
jgi:hypothetical protein